MGTRRYFRALSMACVAGGSVLAASAWFASPATAQIRIAVGGVSAANQQTAPADAQLLQATLRSAVAEAAEKAREKDGCDMVAVDISEDILKARDVEKMLQKKGYAKKDGLKIGKIVISDVINGVVGFNGDGGVDYLIEVTNQVTGQVVARVTGDATRDTMIEAAQKIMDSIVEQACKKKAYRLQARYNDLAIDTVLCDLTQPSSFNGTGQTSGIRFTLTPSGEGGGSFKVGGSAAGLPWSGGGQYALVIADSGGKLDMTGSWQVKSPMGAYGDSGTIPGKLTAFSSTHCNEPLK